MKLRYTPEKHARGTLWRMFFPDWAYEPDENIASSGISFQLWRLNQHFWLVCLFFPIVWLLRTPLPTLQRFLVLAFLLCFAACYTWLMWKHPASSGAQTRVRSRTSFFLFVVLLLLVLLFSLTYGTAFLWLFIGVSAIAGATLPMRGAFIAVVVFTLLPLGISVGTAGNVAQVNWFQLLPLMLLIRSIGVDMIGVARLSGAIRDLHIAKEEVARLSVEQERFRVARDLHDLLGHTLSLIALKSKLAGRLIEKEPARATQEMGEVEHVARESLREVREAVAGYRYPRLESELDGAWQLLEAAGIACSIEYAELSLSIATSTVLAWTVREGVTNIIRHSHARNCMIRFRHLHNLVCVEIINDGELREQTKSAIECKGLGLSGLTERVTALGGRIEACPEGRTGSAGFRLLVELPIQDHREVREEEQV